MDLIGALLLIVIILLALNHAGGGHHSAVMRPVTGIIRRLVSMAFRAFWNILGTVFRLGGKSIRLPGMNLPKETGRGAAPPQPRWKD